MSRVGLLLSRLLGIDLGPMLDPQHRNAKNARSKTARAGSGILYVDFVNIAINSMSG